MLLQAYILRKPDLEFNSPILFSDIITTVPILRDKKLSRNSEANLVWF